jgi:hypothetical protein
MRRNATLSMLLAGLALAASAALQADSLKFVSVTPPNGSPVNGVAPGLGPAGLSAGSTVLATFEYELSSVPQAKIDVFTSGVGGNPPHTGLSYPNTATQGTGQKAVRFGVQCMKGGPAAYDISIIRYQMTDAATNNVLAENIQAVKFHFSCGAKKSTQPSRRRKVKSTT